MKLALLIVSLMVATIYGQLLLAQNSNGNASDVKELEAQQQQTKELDEEALKKAPTKPTKQQAQAKVSASKNKAPNKVFIPTEEISEDKPVAFPVDI